MDIRKWLDKYSIDCKLKYNSLSTQENYISQVKQFLYYFKDEIEPKSISNDSIKIWLLQAKTINTRKHRLCALSSFYSLTINMPDKIHKIPYPKLDRKLPIVLSQDEVQKMFDVCENIKHKVILALLYSCGLRASELINLKWNHLDRQRSVINIIAGKGRKDRQVKLSDTLIPLLEKYYRIYKSKTYVLNGQFSDQYTQSSLLKVIKQVAIKANISKRTYTHLLRHCTFTHMVEKGMDISLISKVAGHNSTKTTMIYCHISDVIIKNTISPLDSIKL
jgi:site-specific recombinase XerD